MSHDIYFFSAHAKQYFKNYTLTSSFKNTYLSLRICRFCSISLKSYNQDHKSFIRFKCGLSALSSARENKIE